jgi:hypothetical protein
MSAAATAEASGEQEGEDPMGEGDEAEAHIDASPPAESACPAVPESELDKLSHMMRRAMQQAAAVGASGWQPPSGEGRVGGRGRGSGRRRRRSRRRSRDGVRGAESESESESGSEGGGARSRGRGRRATRRGRSRSSDRSDESVDPPTCLVEPVWDWSRPVFDGPSGPEWR